MIEKTTVQIAGDAMLTKRHISHDEAQAAMQRLVNSHFNNRDQARMHIPARPDEDDDLVLSAYIRQQLEKDEADEGTRMVHPSLSETR